MKYQELWNDENTEIMERYDLAMERIAGMVTELGGAEAGDGSTEAEPTVAEPYRSYFLTVTGFAGQIEELARRQMRDELESLSLEELQRLNHELYADILPEHYEESYANPDWASKMLGEEFGPLLSAFYAQFREAIVFAYECR